MFLSIPQSGRFRGEGNGNPLWYSCLEDPMNRGAWWATVHGVTKSQVWLKRLSMQSNSELPEIPEILDSPESGLLRWVQGILPWESWLPLHLWQLLHSAEKVEWLGLASLSHDFFIDFSFCLMCFSGSRFHDKHEEIVKKRCLSGKLTSE